MQSLMAIVVALALGLAPAPRFTDVGPGHPFATEVAWAAGTGVVSGYDDGRFRPAVDVSRQALAAVLYRYTGTTWRVPEGWGGPSDVGPGHPFRTEIAWAITVGVLPAYQDGTFRGAGAVSRPEMAAILHAMAGSPAVSEGSQTLPFSDVFEESDLVVPITWVALHGIALGYPDGTFGVTTSVSRQAASAFLFRFEEWALRSRQVGGAELREQVRRELEREPRLGDGHGAVALVEGEGVEEGAVLVLEQLGLGHGGEGVEADRLVG